MKLSVWDVPTRIFHWSLVTAFVALLVASRTESNLETHVTTGYTALALVLFRILWGFSGNKFARFSDFLKGYTETKLYFKQLIARKPPDQAGHNPLVGWLVIFMIGMIITIALTGMVVYSGEENKGIFAGFFSFTTAQYAHHIHVFMANIFICIIVIHLIAALIHEFYFKEKIITSMLTGKKSFTDSLKEGFESEMSVEHIPAVKPIALILLTIIAGWTLFSFTLEGKYDLSIAQAVAILDDKGVSKGFVSNEKWQLECAASCHNAFHPTLLPMKSWKKLMTNLDNHFDEDASLDKETKDEILTFLVRNSAEYSSTEASKKILWFLSQADPPIRITETPYWKRKHAGIKEKIFNLNGIFSRTNCGACHIDAEMGLFEDSNIKVPKPVKGVVEL
jgi:cytochrome b